VSDRKAVLTIAVSGPDGAGKSSLVADLIRALRSRGLAASAAYCYGCVFCRHLGAPGSAAPARPGRHAPAGIRSLVSRPHAVVDAAELTARLLAARLRAGVAARRRPVAVVTDRGPLDGLAKFDPPPGSWPAALFTRLSHCYDLTLLLDGRPEILATRDSEHTDIQLAELRRRYQRWARRLPGVAYLGAEARPESVTSEALRFVLSDAPFPRREADNVVARQEARHAS
jgi:hypothetical protein